MAAALIKWLRASRSAQSAMRTAPRPMGSEKSQLPLRFTPKVFPSVANICVLGRSKLRRWKGSFGVVHREQRTGFSGEPIRRSDLIFFAAAGSRVVTRIGAGPAEPGYSRKSQSTGLTDDSLRSPALSQNLIFFFASFLRCASACAWSSRRSAMIAASLSVLASTVLIS